jgi:hypothetical protein
MNAHTNGSRPVETGLDAPLRFPASTDAGETIQKFLGSAASLWAKQRDKLESLEAGYTARRFEIVESYGKRMRALGNEATDMLRDMDRQHAAALAEAKRMLSALDALRDS